MTNNHKNAANPRVDFTPSGKPTRHGTGTTYNRGCRCEECRANHYNRMQKTFERIRNATLPSGDKRHGTVNGYFNYACRCEPCKAEGAAKNKADYEARKTGYVREFKQPDHIVNAREKRVEEFQSGKRRIKYGTATGYSGYKCRCDKCKKAVSEYNRARNAKKKADRAKSVIG